MSLCGTDQDKERLVSRLRRKIEKDPAHPDAGPDGYVAMPNVSVIEEMVNMMMASRA